MENVDRAVEGPQRHSPLRSLSRNTNEKLSYRLFPVANQRPQVSPRTLQQQTLSQAQRRSISLDDSSRPREAARAAYTQTGNTSVPRIQPVPANRQRGTKAHNGQLSSMFSDRVDDYPTLVLILPKAGVPDVLPYKPRVSEDGGHGRSSSAPGDITKSGCGERKPANRPHFAAAARAGIARPLRGLGGSWYDDRISYDRKNPRHDNMRGKHGRSPPKLEKPLPPPPPPKDFDAQKCLDTTHSRSHSTPLSPTPRSEFYSGPGSASSGELVPLVTPSSLDPNRKSYFPLSADAHMRRLMGIDEMPDVPSMLNMPAITSQPAKETAHQKSSGDLTSPKSKYQKPLPTLKLPTAIETEGSILPGPKKADKETTPAKPPASQPGAEDCQSLAPPSPTFSQASSGLKPAALRITAPKRSVSVSSTLDRKPLQSRMSLAKELSSNKASATPSDNTNEVSATILMTLSELSTQTENLHARYASLREERQILSSAITEALREKKAGPDYVNTVLDHHMSLATICSSMDICIAKLKAVSKRRDRMMATIAASQASIKPKQTSVRGPRTIPTAPLDASVVSSAPASSATTPQRIAYRTPRSEIQGTGVGTPTHQAPRLGRSISPSLKRSQSLSRAQSVSRSISRLEREYEMSDLSDNDIPRRVNMKGAKAAKILGLVVESPVEWQRGRTAQGRVTGMVQVGVSMKRARRARRAHAGHQRRVQARYSLRS